MTTASEPVTTPLDPATTALDPPAARTRPGLLVRGLAAAGIAALVNLAILAVASAAGASMVVAQGGAEIAVGFLPVAVATLVPLALAVVVAWPLAKRWPRTTPILAWAGLAVAAASTAAPLTGALDTGTGVSLAIMHLVAGASWFAALITSRR
ncbi:DUF6069 family protein [Agrococcus terreus]|uniref:Uncharacterized protein n=1 Tax=Agrococcus terreus TaxID=574649 RepID=A0ABQ2KCT7_9MICO|nr:DUF6069 family protein [Agrococcus terreus]GGN77917.1 hypothetical protein GCM10010968_03080 [Agrococcus terreus]